MEENKELMNEEFNEELEIVDLEPEEEGLSTGTKVLLVAGAGLALLGAKTVFEYGKKGVQWAKKKFGKKDIDDDFEDDFIEEEDIPENTSKK